jgi:murein DD-endopeptidase MepM/ murein hydrolase activator NlpD
MKKWEHPMPKGYITSRYGATAGRKSPHRGTDYASPKKKDLIRAVTAGEVVKIDYSKCLGWYLVQKTDDEGLYVGYSHLNCAQHGTDCDGKGHDDGSTCMKNLKVGDKLKFQQPVGRQGNSGTCSKGDHVHATIHQTPDPRYAKTFDIEIFIDEKIKEWNKNELQRKKGQEKEKKELLSKPQKPKQPSSKVVAPEKGENPSESIWGLIGKLWAKKPTGEVCKCCHRPL